MCLRRMSSAHLLKIGHQPAQVVPPRLDLAAEAPAIRVSHLIRRGPNARPSLKVIILFISSTVFVKSGPNARPWASRRLQHPPRQRPKRCTSRSRRATMAAAARAQHACWADPGSATTEAAAAPQLFMSGPKN